MQGEIVEIQVGCELGLVPEVGILVGGLLLACRSKKGQDGEIQYEVDVVVRYQCSPEDFHLTRFIKKNIIAKDLKD